MILASGEKGGASVHLAPVVVLREVATTHQLVLNLAGRYGRPLAMHQCVIFGSAQRCSILNLESVTVGPSLYDVVLRTKSIP